jgi:hypothetical protein
LNGKIYINKEISEDSIALKFHSRFTIDNKHIGQTSLAEIVPLIRPEISLSAEIENSPHLVSGGETIKLIGRIKNSGSVTATHARLSLILPDEIIDTQKIRTLNHAESTKNLLTINEHFDAKYISLLPDGTIPFAITLPLRANLPNDIEKFSLKLIFSATLDDLANTEYETAVETPSLTIAPRPTLSAEARYFTPEGDQIGRGPIPPTVGKETKYWILIRYTNSYYELRDINFSATLPTGVTWTGRSSVSLGEDISLDSNTRKINWKISRLSARSTIGLNFEVAYTPNPNQSGKYFDLLNQISFTASDPITNELITKTIPTINSSLPKDTEAQMRGTLVR